MLIYLSFYVVDDNISFFLIMYCLKIEIFVCNLVSYWNFGLRVECM